MANIRWTYKAIAEEAKKYDTKQVFRDKSSSAYAAAKYRKIIDNVCSHMTSPRTSWTDNMLAEEAKKYQSKIAFKKGSNGAYQTAHKRGLISQICAHMKPKWTYEKIKLATSK